MILAAFSLTEGRREVKSSSLRPSTAREIGISIWISIRAFQFKLTGKVVLEFDLSVKMVGGGPSFSESETVLLVSVLGFEITNNDTGLVITLTVNLEGLFFPVVHIRLF